MDYAGLFPPARLPLDPALRDYARYRSGPDAWMLGRFIVPAARLHELGGYAGLFAASPPFGFSVLGFPENGDETQAPEMHALRRTLAAAQAFEDAHPGRVLADRFEFKLRPVRADEPAALADLFGAAEEGFQARAGAPARGFWEVNLLGDESARSVAAVAAAVAVHNGQAGRPSAGVKLRCGGVTPDAFPSVEALAGALAACREAGVPFKATAGLHHPIRHYADEVGAVMHGFLNVFGAAILARVHGLDRALLAHILADERAEHFAFTGEGFAWTDLGATADDVAETRAHLATSYGSCSFDEPRDDLRALGLLEPAATA